MIWILATRGASTKLRASPFTETPVPAVHSIIYKPGVEPVPFAGEDVTAGQLGAFKRGLIRISGVLFSYHGSVAEDLLGLTAPIDLIIRYRAGGERRKRTLTDVIFLGDAAVTAPAMNSGLSQLIGVPFRVQIPSSQTLADHVIDEVDA